MSAQLLFSRLAVIWSADQLLPAGARALSTSAACWQAAKRQSAPSSAAASQEALVAQLKQQSLLSPRAAEAMLAIDRAHFVQTYTGVPGEIAYQDTPVPIACGQHMDSASTVARFVSLLEPWVQPGAHVLDVGAGTGYVSALLAHLASPGGTVLAIDKQAKLVERSTANVAASSRKLLEEHTLQFKVANAMADPPELQGSALFHAIHLGASAEQVPQQLLALLRPGGRLVLPLGAMHGSAPQVLVAVDKAADGTIHQTEHGVISNRIAPLTAVYDDHVMDT